MARVNENQWLTKWGQNLNAAGQYITDGVKAVTTAPGVKAAAAKDRYLAGVQARVNHWANQVGAVSLSDWQDAMINKGIGRIAAGVSQAQKTKADAIRTLLANVDASVNAANAIPRGNLDQNINRSIAYMRSMSQLSNKNK